MVNATKVYYLLQLRNYGSFTKAAQHIYISQPSLSNAIKELEEEYNTVLVNRSSKKITLTDKGNEIADLAEKAFKIFDNIEVILKKDNLLKFTDPLYFYINPTMFDDFTKNILENASKNFIDTKLLHFNLLTDENPFNKIINSNKNTFIIDSLPEDCFLDEELNYYILDRSNTYLAVAKASDLAKKTTISLTEIADFSLLTTKHPLSFSKYIHAKIKDLELSPIYNYIQSKTSLEQLVGYNSTQALVTIFSKFAKISNKNIAFIPLAPHINFNLSLIYSKSFNNIDLIVSLLQNNSNDE